MNILILEDNLARIEAMKNLFKDQSLYIYSNIQEAKKCIEKLSIQIFFLDHDLDCRIWVDSEEENTGYQLIKWIVNNNLCKRSLFYIHSCNPIGANKMLNYLHDNGYDGIWHPFYLWGVK